jgi:hypothetical protein
MFTVRPMLTEDDLGPEGWRILHEDARRFGRRPNRQALALIQYAIRQRLEGENVELTPKQLDRLLDGRPPLEPVA